jgi:hypothetical protein
MIAVHRRGLINQIHQWLTVKVNDIVALELWIHRFELP